MLFRSQISANDMEKMSCGACRTTGERPWDYSQTVDSICVPKSLLVGLLTRFIKLSADKLKTCPCYLSDYKNRQCFRSAALRPYLSDSAIQKGG